MKPDVHQGLAPTGSRLNDPVHMPHCANDLTHFDRVGDKRERVAFEILNLHELTVEDDPAFSFARLVAFVLLCELRVAELNPEYAAGRKMQPTQVRLARPDCGIDLLAHPAPEALVLLGDELPAI